MFQNVDNFKVEGGGIINGNGNTWWKKSCKINKDLVSTLCLLISFQYPGLLRNCD